MNIRRDFFYVFLYEIEVYAVQQSAVNLTVEQMWSLDFVWKATLLCFEYYKVDTVFRFTAAVLLFMALVMFQL